MRNNKNIIVKLSAFEPSKKEDPIYRAQAYSNDKVKGNMMIQYLKNLFNISAIDEQKHFRKEVEEQKKMISKSKINWTRDEDGKIISPFSAKLKRKEEDL